jgi:hypothetical protein
LFKSHDKIQEEASQAKTKGMAEQSAAGKKGCSSGEQPSELQK